MINIRTMNKLDRDDELIKRVLINRGYDKDIIDALLETGYSNELPVYNDLTKIRNSRSKRQEINTNYDETDNFLNTLKEFRNNL